MIDGKQCTVVWYVDDNKVSHVDPDVVTSVLEMMKKHFGNITVTRGNKHRFLGMNITINKDKNIEIDMREQLQEVLDMFSCTVDDTIDKAVTSPAEKHLMDVNANGIPLDHKKKEAFHSIVAKLL